MSTLIDEASKIFRGDLSVTHKDYARFMKALSKVKGIDKVKLAEILFNKVSLQPKFLTVQDLETFEKILPLWKMNNNLTDIICRATNRYKKESIFTDNLVAQKAADILVNVPKNEYMVISALLNNGFGDKDKLKQYLDSLSPKTYNTSIKIKALYTKAINFCSEL